MIRPNHRMNSVDILVATPTDDLFQKWNISTIKSMQDDLEREIIRKRDEIRVLVGEKYREFVDVSEKIHIMNEITKNIKQETEVISFNQNEFSSMFDAQALPEMNCLKTSEKIKNERRIAVLRKLLIDTENQIWMEMDSKRFITVTCLLQFAIHTKTVLNLDCVDQKERSVSILYGIWDSIHRFPSIINQFIKQELQQVNLISTMACECFCASALLQNLSCIKVVETFLALRLETLGSLLHKENTTENVRSRFCNSFLLIVRTLEVLYHCFGQPLPQDNGEYLECLKNVINSKYPMIFHCINKDGISAYEEIYIPSAIKNFSVKINDLLTPMDRLKNCEMVNDWLQNVRNRIITYLPNYLNLVNSLQSLSTLKQVVQVDDESWLQILIHFDTKEHFLLWETVYEPLIVERAKIILSQRWDVLFARVRQKIENSLQNVADANKREGESDLNSFLWTSNYDAWTKISSQSTGISFSDDLRTKVLGLSPNTRKLCAFIESLVSDIMNELSVLCLANNSESHKSLILREHQRNCCIGFVEKLIILTKELNAVESVTDETTLLLARFLSGISVFCPSLKQCASVNDEANEWSILTTKLSEESLNVWRKWSYQALRLIRSELESFNGDVLTASFKLKYLTKWCAVKLTGENDNVNLDLRVPFQTSYFVQNVINELSKINCRALPPKIISIKMKNEVVTEILNSMEKAEKRLSCSVVQLQFLFDVQYLRLSLISVDDEKLNQRSKQIIDELERKVDPVDLDLISSSLSSSVHSCVYNTQGIFGSLMNEKPLTTIEQQVDNSEDPSTIYVATNDIPSFPLFPISSMHHSG